MVAGEEGREMRCGCTDLGLVLKLLGPARVPSTHQPGTLPSCASGHSSLRGQTSFRFLSLEEKLVEDRGADHW